MNIRPFALLATALLGAVVLAQSLDDVTRVQEGRTGRSSSCNPDWQGSNFDYRFIRPGETLNLARIIGPGKITHLWMTILPSEPGYSRLMTLRIYWDGETRPSVECPIGDFFGVGHGLDVSYESMVARASAGGRARSSYWVMPFRKAAKVTVTNDGSEATWGFYFHVDYEKCAVPKDAPYFHAMYRQEKPCRPGNYLIADIQGRGHYVGTVLSCHSNTPGWWGEGDDFFFIDGETKPSIRGTGLEDYFGEAWGLRKTSGAWTGTTVFTSGDPGALATCYRWHVNDPVRFTKSLRVEIEHKGVATDANGKDLGNNNERSDDYSSVAFWYQLGTHKPFPPLPAGPDRLPFDMRRMVEGETLNYAVKTTFGPLKVNKVPGLHGGAQLEWEPKQPGGSMDVPFDVPADGDYQIMLLTTEYWGGGKFDFLVDGKPYWGVLDFYNFYWITHRQDPLRMRHFTKGRHVLTVRSQGKDADAESYGFLLDGFVLQPRSVLP